MKFSAVLRVVRPAVAGGAIGLLSVHSLASAYGQSQTNANTQASIPAPRSSTALNGLPAGVDVPAEYVIGPEDVLAISFWRDTDMTGDVVVRPDGRITLPLLGDITAAGLTPEALKGEILSAASKLMTDPNVTVIVRQINSRKVFITGQVAQPGAYPLMGPRTVMQLIALAGGLTEYADKKGITIVRTDSGRTRSFKFNYTDVARGRKLEQNIVLKPGDTIVVP